LASTEATKQAPGQLAQALSGETTKVINSLDTDRELIRTIGIFLTMLRTKQNAKPT
jgi:hypothetical protein